MSIRIMSEVWKLKLPDSQMLLLLALADWANDDGVCWPSISKLSDKINKSERTIQRAIQGLMEEGHLSREERPGNGVVYTVHPRHLCHPRHGVTPVTRVTPPPSPVSPNTSYTHQVSVLIANAHKTDTARKFVFAKPEGVSDGAWRDFLAVRKAKKAVNTETAYNGLMSRMQKLEEEGFDRETIVTTAAERGWQSFYAPKSDNKPASKPSSFDSMAAAAVEYATGKFTGF